MLNTQTRLGHQALRHSTETAEGGRIRVNSGHRMGRGGNKEATYSLYSPRRQWTQQQVRVGVQPPLGQSEEQRHHVGLMAAHSEARPRVEVEKGSKKSQCSTACCWCGTKDSADLGTAHPSRCGSQGCKILTEQIINGLKKTFQTKWTVCPRAKPVRKSRTSDV